MKKLLLFLTFTTLFASAQVVTIPDANFRAVLLFKYDFNTDGQIQNTEIDTVKTLNVTAMSIANLTGIEAFTDLENLWCGNNQITTMNLVMNSNLFRLTCGNNQINSLNLSANPTLKYLDCPNNLLTNLNLSSNIALYDVICSGNQISNINLGSNITLGGLDISGNNLTTINLSQNTGLTFLRIFNNQLTFLDVRLNTSLNYLGCSYNPNLSQICVNPNQYFNLTSTWIKDAFSAWVNNCTSTSVIELESQYTSTTINNIYNLFGQEVTSDFAKENNGVYIYQFSNGAVKKITNFK